MKPVGDLDPSVAFTVLLEVDPDFGSSPDDGGATVRRFLDDWYSDPSLDMYEFGQRWVIAQSVPHGPDERIVVEAIEPGSALWLMNCADPSCEGCRGTGTLQSDGLMGSKGERCPCVDPARADA